MASAFVVAMSEGCQVDESIEVSNKHVMVLVKQEDHVAMEDLGWPTDLHSKAFPKLAGLLPHEDVNSDVVRFFKWFKICGVHWVNKHAEVDSDIDKFGNKRLRNSTLEV